MMNQLMGDNSKHSVVMKAPEEKAEPPQAMNALMRLNQLKPGLQYKLLSQTGPIDPRPGLHDVRGGGQQDLRGVRSLQAHRQAARSRKGERGAGTRKYVCFSLFYYT